jgi:hypothetical protein
MSSLPYRGGTHLGMDVYNDSISIGILEVDKILPS